MIYVVSGDGPRCGSTMMMEALKAGGMMLAYDVEHHIKSRELSRAAEIQLMLELTEQEMKLDRFPDPAIYDDKAIKVMPDPWMPLARMMVGEYRVIWLHRPKEHRWASYQSLMPKQELSWATGEQCDRERMSKSVLAIIHERPDMDITECDFANVVAFPIVFFSALASAGWPIDPYAVSLIPDCNRKHF